MTKETNVISEATQRYYHSSPTNGQKALSDFILQTATIAKDLNELAKLNMHARTPESIDAANYAEQKIRDHFLQLTGHALP